MTRIFTTTAGVEVPYQPVSFADLELAKSAVEQEFRDAGKPIDPPTYEVKLELEGTSEHHPHTIRTIQDASDEDKAKWDAHQEALIELGDEIQKRTSLIFAEGILYDLPEDDSWIARRKRLFNEDVPEDPEERRVHYINNVLLKTPADKEGLMEKIYEISLTGAGEEAVQVIMDGFRSQVAITKREALTRVKTAIKEQEDMVLQSEAEGQSSGKGVGDVAIPISQPAGDGPGGDSGNGTGSKQDERVGELSRSIKTGSGSSEGKSERAA